MPAIAEMIAGMARSYRITVTREIDHYNLTQSPSDFVVFWKARG